MIPAIGAVSLMRIKVCQANQCLNATSTENSAEIIRIFYINVQRMTCISMKQGS